MNKSLILCLACCIGLQLSAQTIYYVDQSATGAGTGSSWNNAFIRLQQALAVAQNGDQVWVARGTYKPTTNNDRFAYFNLPSGVAVYGGFSGTETALDQRNWTDHPTILSGDIGAPGDTTDNSFTILYTYSPNDKTRLDGLIFEEGTATDPDPAADAHRPTRSGGGVYVDGEHFGYAELSIAHCIFRRNRAAYQGGGLFANGREGGMAMVRLNDCLFEQNIAQTFGGGFCLENYYEQPFDLEVKNCIFRENFAQSAGTAVWLRANQDVAFDNCQFLDNRNILGATVSFDKMDNPYSARFSKCVFKGNSDFTIWYHFQGISTILEEPEFLFESCTFEQNGLPVILMHLVDETPLNVQFNHCIFNANARLNPTGTPNVSLSTQAPDSDAYFNHCLFYKNQSWEIGASSKIDVFIINSILIGDLQHIPYERFFSGGSEYHLYHSLFNHSDCSGFNGNSLQNVFCHEGNLFELDPVFSDTLQADFHLSACSPLINAGANAVPDSLNLLFDFDGRPRIANGIADIGPYERLLSLNANQNGISPCPGANSGSIELDPDLCPPYVVYWDNGDTTGTTLHQLAAGTYVLIATDANNVMITDTIVIVEPDPVVMDPVLHHVSCHGGFDGWIEGNASGGTPPYFYWGSGPSPWFPYNLQAGSYQITATDAYGCTSTSSATITSPDPFQWYYTIDNASCPTCADGSIVFDSITGGVNPPLPNALFDLLPGSYSTTITDQAGCYAVLQYNIGVTVGATDIRTDESFQYWPNPVATGETAHLAFTGTHPAHIRVFSASGTLLYENTNPDTPEIALKIVWPPGMYWVECSTEKGSFWLVKWVVH
jgi:hypothetical protein